MITITTWLWSQGGNWQKYNPSHVYRLKSMLDEHLTIPYKFICFHDGSFGELDVETKAIPDLNLSAKSWPESKYPQCFNRLFLFSESAKSLGERVASIDLDCSIYGNIDHLFTRNADFTICYSRRNLYAGSFWVLNTGSRTEVYDKLSVDGVNDASKKHVGSDQAWIRYILGPDEDVIGPNHGVYHWYSTQHIPNECKIMFFSGRKKPKEFTSVC